MNIFPQNPVWFSLRLITALRNSEKCTYKPSIRQAIAICKLILARFLNRGECEVDDFIDIAAVTSPLENRDIARQLARELLSFSESSKGTNPQNIASSDIFGEFKAKNLLNNIETDFSELDEIFDDFDFLRKHFDEIENLDVDSLMESTFSSFFDRFGDKLEEEPYKTALDVIDKNAIVNFDKMKDLKSLVEYAKNLLKKKINNLEPEDIGSAEKLGILEEIIKKTKTTREKILSQFVKTTSPDKAKPLKEAFQGNFLDALNIADFAIKGNILDDKSKKVVKGMFQESLSKPGRNIDDLFKATKIMGSSLSMDDDQLDKIVRDSSDLSFKDAYQSVKGYDQYFGGNLSEKYLKNINNNLDNLKKGENIEDIRNHLIKHPTKIPSWRKLLNSVVDKEIQSIKKDYNQDGALNAQMKNLADNLIASQNNCTDFVCRSQLNTKIQDVVNQSTELAVSKENLRSYVKNFNEMGFLPNLDSIKKAGKRLKMTEAEILSLVEANFKHFKKLVEEKSATYQGYRDYLKQLRLSPQQIEQIIKAAMGSNPPLDTNLDALSALNEKYLSQVLNMAERMGDQALDTAFSSLGAGRGLDLLEQWFFSRHNISQKVKKKLKEIIKHIMIDLGVRSANSLIGSANSGPIVENIVIPYTPGDDFELIDLEETISNLLEKGKTVETISNDDFLVSKTTQGLRCLVLELDISGSMTGQKLSQMALCATMLVYAFKPEELALTFFESNTHRVKDLDQEIELEEVVDELLEIKARGGTCINSALKWANNQFEKKGRSKYKLNVLFTDADVFDFNNSIKELKKMSEKDIKFVMVVPKFNFSSVMAKKMVNEAKGVLLTLNQWRDFPKLISEIITNQ